MIRDPYTKEVVRAVVERRGGGVIPLTFHKWWGQGTWDKHGERLLEISQDVPTDIPAVTYLTPVVGVALGVIVLAERVSWNEPVGAVIVVLGIAITQGRVRLTRC